MCIQNLDQILHNLPIYLRKLCFANFFNNLFLLYLFYQLSPTRHQVAKISKNPASFSIQYQTREILSYSQPVMAGNCWLKLTSLAKG